MTDDLPKLGWNDASGKIYCNLCDWTAQGNHIETIEAVLLRHLDAAHGKRALYRRPGDTGEKIEIPK